MNVSAPCSSWLVIEANVRILACRWRRDLSNMTTAASKSGYTVADLAREFAGEFTKEEIQQHLQGTTAPSQPSAKVSPCVFVAGLCWATTSDRLYDFFGSCGAVVSADVSMDRGTGRSRGYGLAACGCRVEKQTGFLVESSCRVRRKPTVVCLTWGEMLSSGPKDHASWDGGVFKASAFATSSRGLVSSLKLVQLPKKKFKKTTL